MSKTLLFCLALSWMTSVGRAQEPALPTIRILPEDVIQDTIRYGAAIPDRQRRSLGLSIRREEP